MRIQKALLIIGCCLIAFGSYCAAAEQLLKPNDIGYVSHYFATFHKEPLGESPEVTRIYRGDEVKISTISPQRSACLDFAFCPVSQWYYVEITGRGKGWVHPIFISRVSGTETELLRTATSSIGVPRRKALKDLALLKSKAALPLLLKDLDDPQEGKYPGFYLEALGTYRDPGLVPVFLKHLSGNEREVIRAIGNYSRPDLAKHILPFLDSTNMDIKNAAISSLSRTDDKSIQEILQSKKDDLRLFLADLHQAFVNDDIKLLAPYLDEKNGFFLRLISGSEYRYDGHMSRKEAMSFFLGESTDTTLDSDFYSIKNITDFEVEVIYSDPERTLINDPAHVQFLGEYSGSATTKGKIVDSDRYLRIFVKWKDFSNKTIDYHYGAYLDLFRQKGKWYLVGLEQMYG